MRIFILLIVILFFQCTYDPEKREERNASKRFWIMLFVTEILPNTVDYCPKPDLILEKGKTYSVTLVEGQRFWFDYATRINADRSDYQYYNLTLTKDSQATVKLNYKSICNTPVTYTIELTPKQSSANQLLYQESLRGGSDNMRNGHFFTLSSGSGNITLTHN